MGLLTRGERRPESALPDLFRSLAVILGFVFVTGAFFLFGRGHPDPVRVVDTRPVLAQARAAAGYHVLAPTGLSADWRPTSVRTDTSGGHVAFHIGYVTPGDEYAGLEESDGPAAPFVRQFLGDRPEELPTTQVGGATWRQVRATNGELALVRTAAGATTVVHGTARGGELVTLAAALR